VLLVRFFDAVLDRIDGIDGIKFLRAKAIAPPRSVNGNNKPVLTLPGSFSAAFEYTYIYRGRSVSYER